MKTLAIFILVLSFPSFSQAQVRYYYDAVQSQVFDNPASIGGNGSSTLRASYNDHLINSIASYQRGNMYFDKGIVLTNNNVLAYSIGVHRDRAGANNYGLDYASLAIAYHKVLNRDEKRKHYLSVGSALTGNRRSISGELRWPTQIDPITGFDPDHAPTEGFSPNVHYLGFDLGLFYSFYWNHQYIKAGVSIQDVNRPNASFYENGNSPLETGVVINFLGKLNFSKKWDVAPQMRFFDFKNFSRLHLGTNLGYQATPKTELIAGVASHDYSFYTVTAGAEVGGTRAMLIYGWRTENVLPTQKVLELSLSYQFGGTIKSAKMKTKEATETI